VTTLGLIQRILAPSFVDGPGSRMAVFLQGCNLHCRYCHNPETQGLCVACGACIPACPGGALSLDRGSLRFEASRCQACDRCIEACPASASPRTFPLTPRQLRERVRSAEPFLDGLTFSGGECTLQGAFLLDATRLLKRETPLSVLLDTNGSMGGDLLEALAKATDGFLFDLKAVDDDLHFRLTGAGNVPILRNLIRAARLGKVVEVRTIVVPGYTDTETEIHTIAQFVKDLAPDIPLRLTPFRPHGVRQNGLAWPAMDPADLKRLIGIAQGILGKDRLRAPG
jgi:pyruvate formate lyase activating enzyme